MITGIVEQKHSSHFIERIGRIYQLSCVESRMLRFVIAEEDLRIKTSYPFNEVTAVHLLNNPRYQHMYM